MNYCTKCESYYTKPGTCNCYAVVDSQQFIYPTPRDYPWVVVTGSSSVTYDNTDVPNTDT